MIRNLCFCLSFKTHLHTNTQMDYCINTHGTEDVQLSESYCLFSSLQEANADEFEDKEWTFVIEGVSIS